MSDGIRDSFVGRSYWGPVMKTLREWAKEYEEKHGITLLDPDGFDRSDPNMWDLLYTREQFENGLYMSTIQPALPFPESVSE